MVRAWKLFPSSQLQSLLRAACTIVLGAAAGPSMESRMYAGVQSSISNPGYGDVFKLGQG